MVSKLMAFHHFWRQNIHCFTNCYEICHKI